MASALPFGGTLLKPFAIFDRDTCSWKTYPASGREDSEESQVTWPKYGMTCGGYAYALPISAHHIYAIDGSLSPLLKTPTANLATNGGARHPDERNAGGHGPTLDDELCFLLPPPSVEGVQEWGIYGPAITRWERITRQPAPVPTELCRRNARRIRARFAEWLMGLSPGWVTSVKGLDRSEQLKVIGNSVVPLQAYRAYRYLMRESER